MRIQDKEPSFVLGIPKSGTTLMMSLLDGHDELLAFPEQCPYLKFPVNGIIGDDLLQSLFQANKLPRFHNQQIPADMVNKEKKDYCGLDYRQFSRSATTFFRCHENSVPDLSLAGLALLALMHGFADVTGRKEFKRWVLKKPKYEFHIQNIINDFPKAKLIYLLRNPAQSSISRSIKRKKKEHVKNVQAGLTNDQLRLDKPGVNFSDLYEWKQSVSKIKLFQKKYPSQILIVRYEDLTQRPKDIMTEVAVFLGIGWQSSLLTPTFMGKPWAGNSMRDKKFSAVEKNPPRMIPIHTQWQVQSILGRTMNDWGYIPEVQIPRINIRGFFSLLPGENWKTATRSRISFILRNRSKHQR